MQREEERRVRCAKHRLRRKLPAGCDDPVPLVRLFGNDKHDAELANARRIVLALTSELGALEDKVKSRKEQIKAADKNTPLTVLVL